LGEGTNENTVEFVYNCIMGKLTIAALDAVTSMVHFKMKYPNKDGEVVTIPADLDKSNRFHRVLQKSSALESASIFKGVVTGNTDTPMLQVFDFNVVDFDVCHEEKNYKGERDQETSLPL
jgi:hypothetical protein